MLMQPSPPSRRHRALRRPARIFVFFPLFFALQIFLQKNALKNRKNRRSGVFGLPEGPKKNKKVEKTRKWGPPGLDFGSFLSLGLQT